MPHFWHKWWAIIATLALFFVLLVGGGLYVFAQEGKIYPGVKVASFPLGGLTPSEAEKTLAAGLRDLRSSGLLFVYGSRQVSVPMTAEATTDPDLSYELIAYEPQAMIERAYGFGRGKSFWRNWQERLAGLLSGEELPAVYAWRQDKIMETLKGSFSSLENPGADAAIKIENGQVEVSAEKVGNSFNYAKAILSARGQLDAMLFAPIALEMRRDIPKITKTETTLLWPQLRELAKKIDPFTVAYREKSWQFSRSQINELLQFGRDKNGQAILSLNGEKFAARVLPIASEINKPAQEPKFRMENGRVVEFAAPSAGAILNLGRTLALWQEDILQNNKNELALVIDETPANGQVGDLNDLGIKEILGTGTSNFAGSPANRRHNIKAGADSLDGILIAPGEEFSLLKALGEINAAAGYLPELVIKGNKTVPEYGGGLCQIGTTIFRATMASGLPVTQRRNHSYAVTYYNDTQGRPGKDATIYNPSPDYRFKNDTGNYILIQTRIEGDNLYFDFWGTPDGRTAEQSEVRVWDRVGSGPTKFVETLDLKPGQKKCTEAAHAGIKAEFDYKIVYADGREDKQKFFSQYRPWQAVCLIGVEKLSEEPAEGSADAPPESGTDNIVDSPPPVIQ